MVEPAYGGAFVTEHLGGLQFERDSLDRIRLVFRVSPPENGFDVVLEERDRRGALPREIEGRSEEVANRDVEAAFIQPPGQQLLRLTGQELGDSEWRAERQPAQIQEVALQCRRIARGRVNDLRPRQVFTDLALIGLITPTAVIGQKGDFVTSGEFPQNVI